MKKCWNWMQPGFGKTNINKIVSHFVRSLTSIREITVCVNKIQDAFWLSFFSCTFNEHKKTVYED
jgi:hypothetical protein